MTKTKYSKVGAMSSTTSTTSDLNWQRYPNCIVTFNENKQTCVAILKHGTWFEGPNVCYPSNGNNCYENNNEIKCNPERTDPWLNLYRYSIPKCNFTGEANYYAKK